MSSQSRDPNAKNPLTNQMVETLMELHERELMNLEPYDASLVRSAPGLIHRGFAYAKTYITQSGKKITGLYITPSGIKYLD